MKYKDYYKTLGVEHNADTDAVKKAYRKLAHKYHPDVSKDPDGEEKFKAVAEAYETLKNPDKRAAYDQLGSYQTGQDFRPHPDWQKRYADSGFAFDDADLADLFAGLAGGRQRAGRTAGEQRFDIPLPGQDFEVTAQISLEDAYHGTLLDLNLNVPEFDVSGHLHRTPRAFKARIPKGATDGQRLRLPAKGGKGFNGGRDGDLFLNIALLPHRLFRVSTHDLYLDLPLAPWEAALGTSVEVPTLGGGVRLKVPPGTAAGQKLRLAKRGLPKPREGEGDLFAIVQIVMPAVLSEGEQTLLKELADNSTFNPRSHFNPEATHDK